MIVNIIDDMMLLKSHLDKQLVENEKLEKQRDNWSKRYGEMYEENEKLEKQRDELRKQLENFDEVHLETRDELERLREMADATIVSLSNDFSAAIEEIRELRESLRLLGEEKQRLRERSKLFRDKSENLENANFLLRDEVRILTKAQKNHRKELDDLGKTVVGVIGYEYQAESFAQVERERDNFKKRCGELYEDNDFLRSRVIYLDTLESYEKDVLCQERDEYMAAAQRIREARDAFLHA